jgi:hypothetical protein
LSYVLFWKAIFPILSSLFLLREQIMSWSYMLL